ncbi:uncharacterized protein AAG666_011145 isoform 1-T2 [Megaptera novaeangliae]
MTGTFLMSKCDQESHGPLISAPPPRRKLQGEAAGRMDFPARCPLRSWLVRPHSFLSWSSSPLCLEGVAGVCGERVVTHMAPAQLGGPPGEDLGTVTSGPRRRCLPFQILQWGTKAFIPPAESPGGLGALALALGCAVSLPVYRGGVLCTRRG